MAVFGEAITEGNRMERALKASEYPNAGDKYDQAVFYVREQNTTSGAEVSTLCVFYNATGETLIYQKDDPRRGNAYKPYPTRVENGQWGAFLHVKTAAIKTGTCGFVVYRTNLDDTNICNPLLAWETPFNDLSNNHAYCTIFADGKGDSDDEVYKNLEKSTLQHSDDLADMHITASIQTGTSPLYEARITRNDRPRQA